MSFGSNLIDLREKHGVSRKELAERLDIPYTTLRNYETDQREPGHKLLIQIASLFSVSVDELIGNEAEKEQLTKIGELSGRELALIQSMQGLSPNEQELALDLCSALVLELLRHHKVAAEKQAAVPAVSSH